MTIFTSSLSSITIFLDTHPRFSFLGYTSPLLARRKLLLCRDVACIIKISQTRVPYLFKLLSPTQQRSLSQLYEFSFALESMRQLRMHYIIPLWKKSIFITVCMTTLAATFSPYLPGHKTMIACVHVYFKNEFLSGNCVLNVRFGTARCDTLEKGK